MRLCPTAVSSEVAPVLLTRCLFIGNVQAVIEPSIPAVLRERARLRPSETAFTFIDYEQDSAGVAESLTSSQGIGEH